MPSRIDGSMPFLPVLLSMMSRPETSHSITVLTSQHVEVGYLRKLSVICFSAATLVEEINPRPAFQKQYRW